MSAIWTVHVAAPPVGAIQVCAACGFTLKDNTAWFEGRVAVMDGDDRGMPWWPTGERIGTDMVEGRCGGCTFVVEEGRPLNADEQLCVGVN